MLAYGRRVGLCQLTAPLYSGDVREESSRSLGPATMAPMVALAHGIIHATLSFIRRKFMIPVRRRLYRMRPSLRDRANNILGP
jgi:hypothetical protein